MKAFSGRLQRLYLDLRNAVTPMSMIIAVAAFVLGQLVFHYLLSVPSRDRVETSRQKVETVTDTYLQLKSTDINELVDRLQVEVGFIKQKEKDIFSNPLTQEQIPLLVSKIEKEAENEGLRIDTSVSRNQTKGKNAVPTTSINLSFRGSFREIMSYLYKLDAWEDNLLITNFKLERPESEGASLNGQLQFLSVMSN